MKNYLLSHATFLKIVPCRMRHCDIFCCQRIWEMRRRELVPVIQKGTCIYGKNGKTPARVARPARKLFQHSKIVKYCFSNLNPWIQFVPRAGTILNQCFRLLNHWFSVVNRWFSIVNRWFRIVNRWFTIKLLSDCSSQPLFLCLCDTDWT